MPIDARITIDDKAVLAAFERLRLALPLGGDSTPAMRAIGRVLKTATQMRFKDQKGPDGVSWPKSRRAATTGGQTLRDSSRLRNSISVDASHDRVAVGTNVIYAAVHHFGGIIRAKKGPFLAIPLTPQARAAGSPRRMSNLAFVQTRKGQYLMVDSGSGKPHFLLRKQIKMPARPFLGASGDDRHQLLQVLEDHYHRIWEK